MMNYALLITLLLASAQASAIPADRAHDPEARPVLLTNQQDQPAAVPVYDMTIGIPGQLVLFGDSFVQYSFQPFGTGSSLADAYQRTFDVVNRGYTSYTSHDARYAAPLVLTPSTPIQLLVLWFGTNDIISGRTPSEYRADLHFLLDSYFDSRPAQNNTFYTPCALVMTPTPNVHTPLDKTRTYLRIAEEVAIEQAQKQGKGRVQFVDIHEALANEAMELGKGDLRAGLMQLLSDGVHPSAAGYKIITQQIMRVVNNYMPQLYPTRLPWSMPRHINTEDPASSFPHASGSTEEPYVRHAISTKKPVKSDALIAAEMTRPKQEQGHGSWWW